MVMPTKQLEIHLELSREVWDGDTDSEVVSTEMVFKALKLDETTWVKNGDRKEVPAQRSGTLKYLEDGEKKGLRKGRQ